MRGSNTKVIQQRLTDQMRRPVAGVMQPDIDGGFAVVDREQLPVQVGHVHEVHIAEPRQMIGVATRRLCSQQ